MGVAYKMDLTWEFDGPGWPYWRVMLEPFFILVGPTDNDPNLWQWNLNVHSDAGESLVQRSGKPLRSAYEAKVAAEKYFCNMVKKWPAIEVEN